MRKQLGWKAPAWGFFFGTLPDLDILISPFLAPLDQLGWHRGLSHSILIMLLASVAFGYFLAKIHREKGITPLQAGGFVFLTWSTHVLIDCFTTYGTQIYEPFSNTRVTLNNIAIIDLCFTLPMLLALLIVFFFKKESTKRTWIGRGAMLWLCFYTSLSFYFKHLATTHFEERLADEGITPSRMITAPTLSNIFLWRMLAESDGHYYITYWSIFDQQDRRDPIDKIAHGHDGLGHFAASAEVQKLIWFAQGWHYVARDTKDSQRLLIVDMRFNESHTTLRKIPTFAWHVTHHNNSYQFQDRSFRKDIPVKETLHLLWERISGRAPRWMDGSWPWEAQK